MALVVSWGWFLFGSSVDLSGAFIGVEVGEIDEGLTDGSYYLGSIDAPVVIQIFSDFECPYCKTAWSTLKQVETEYVDTGKVKFVFNHYPLDFHENAMGASLASMCAGEQGNFWAYHDKLFENQGSLSDTYYLDLAYEFGFDLDGFEDCFNSNKYYGMIRQDMSDARNYGVGGTPAFLINGELVSGTQSYSEFVSLIEKNL